MKEAERKKAAKTFSEYWKDKGYERGECQPFWLSLLRDVFEVVHPERYISFEDKVFIDHTSFIDGYIEKTHVLIEQKSAGKSLKKPIRQSDGSFLTPFQQAKRYAAELPYSKRPRWIIICNFTEFLIYDMEKPTGAPESILLCDLAKEYYRLQFIIEEKSELLHKEEQISVKAGELVGRLYESILKQYIDPENRRSLHSLNILCVRLVFCFYAEDAGIFGERLQFHNYIKSFETKEVRRAVIDLFRVLDTKYSERDPYLDERLAAFPYVNGGLFADENIEIPNFNEEIVSLILNSAGENFDWSQISPTIFGAVFESTLNPETRRSGGMHYTSIENIHKVIDPLFLNGLRGELAEIKTVKVPKLRKEKAEAFRRRLSELTFLDPACGSGNFLTETYISLRRLENEALTLIYEGQVAMDFGDVIKVSIGQFYGIEINDFAVTVAKTALWIAESQMMKETEELLNAHLDFLPLKSYAGIVEGNALKIAWEKVVPKSKLNYIMGNPPFVGYSLQTAKQKQDIISIYTDEHGKTYKTAGKVDYVAGWYFKASHLMRGTKIRTAFVSTNSITQGEQTAAVWKPLYERFLIHIDFAHRTFRWNSEANFKANVHCVIVGFSTAPSSKQKKLYSSEKIQLVDNINAYLLPAPDIFIESRKTPLCAVPSMMKGSIPVDDGNFFLNSDEEYEEFITKEPQAKKYIRKFYGAKEYLHNISRRCLWLDNITPSEIKEMPYVSKRILAVKEFRLKSTKEGTRKYANYPTKFMEIRQPKTQYILFPSHSSENRKYIPIGFVNPDIICGNANLLISNADFYHFGILMSNVHMAWVRAICGRIKSDYRYSADIVYNNFPWCRPTAEQKAKIEETAQGILNARSLYPDSSLAELYDEVAMPPELRQAHQANDRAVMQAYGFWGKLNSESECVAELMKMYKKLSEK